MRDLVMNLFKPVEFLQAAPQLYAVLPWSTAAPSGGVEAPKNRILTHRDPRDALCASEVI